MIVEILNTNVLNKGAQLMLAAIVDKLRNDLSTATLCVRPHERRLPYEECCRLGIRLKLPPKIGFVSLQNIQSWVPQRLRQAYGVVMESEVDAMLDASGFAYSSQWGDSALKVMAERSQQWHKEGKRVVLMPQAFGPFETLKQKAWMRKIVESSRLVFARDPKSLEYLRECADDAENIHIAPDLTIGYGCHPPGVEHGESLHGHSLIHSAQHAVIVPNARIVDKGAASSGDSYVTRLACIARFVHERGYPVAFLIHEGKEDHDLAQRVIGELSFECALWRPNDATEIKHVLGHARLVIASRFHALVSALSNCVPVVAMGWSHKYRCLLEDFGMGNFLIGNEDELNTEEISLFDELLNTESYDQRLISLHESQKRQYSAWKGMWDRVLSQLREFEK